MKHLIQTIVCLSMLAVQPGVKFPYADESWNQPAEITKLELHCLLLEKEVDFELLCRNHSLSHEFRSKLKTLKYSIKPTNKQIEIQIELSTSLFQIAKFYKRPTSFYKLPARAREYSLICKQVRLRIEKAKLSKILETKSLRGTYKDWPMTIRLIQSGTNKKLHEQKWVWSEERKEIILEK